MKSIVLKKFGGVENLQVQNVAIPNPEDNEVLIKVKNIGLNPVDYKTRQGGGIAGRMQLPVVLGWDVSGVVSKLGSGVSKFKVGDAVFGMVNFPGTGSAYAEHVIAPGSQLALKPRNVTFEEAAAIPLAGLTAYQALVHVAKVEAGDSVLVQAAAGGVGHLAVQILKNLGAIVIGTASAKNEEFLNELGVDQFINYKESDFAVEVENADIVFDGVGGEVGKRSLLVLKKGGTIISIPSGVKDDWKKDRDDVQTPSFLVQSDGSDMEALANMMSEGKLKVKIAKVYPLEKVGEAHLQLETQRTQGKIILSI